MSPLLEATIGTYAKRAGARIPASTALLFTLSFIAGMVDVTSFVLLHGVFTAHITGNLVVLASAVATHQSVAFTGIAAIAVFIVITAALTAIVDQSSRPPYRWAQAFVTLQFGLLIAVAVAAVLFHAADHDGSGGDWVAMVQPENVIGQACGYAPRRGQGNRSRVHQRGYGTKRLHHPVVGEITVDFETLTLPADSEQTLYVYTAAAGSPSQQALDLLGSWTHPINDAASRSVTANGSMPGRATR